MSAHLTDAWRYSSHEDGASLLTKTPQSSCSVDPFFSLRHRNLAQLILERQLSGRKRSCGDIETERIPIPKQRFFFSCRHRIKPSSVAGASDKDPPEAEKESERLSKLIV
jgi:hypothetical protein